MKWILIYCLTIQVTAYSQIIFFKGTYEEAVQKAKLEHKLLFLDCYTSWCGPCKLLDKNTFSDPELGKVFNENYICIKMDMEGAGTFIAEKHQINSYPTMLWLDSDEKEILRISGYHGAKELLTKINENKGTPLLDESSLPIFQKQFAKGIRDSIFLQNYISILSQTKKPFEVILREYLELFPIHHFDESQWKWLFDVPKYYKSIATQYLIDYKKTILKYKSESEFEMRIQTIVEQSAFETGTQNDHLSFSDLKKFIAHSNLKDQKKLELLADIKYAEGSNNMDQYSEFIWKYIDQYDAKNAYSIGKDLMLKSPSDRSLSYIEKILSKSNEDYFQKLLLAKVFRLQKNEKKAIRMLEDAIELGKKSSIDTSEAQKMLLELGN
jgi:thioredoxin-related protein